MTTRSLRWLAMLLPPIFLGIILLLRSLLFHEGFIWQRDLLTFIPILLGSVFFSNWLFQIIRQREIEIRSRTEQLAALNEAALALTTELDLSTVLQKVVDQARQLVQARYGALAILDPISTAPVQFITSGLSEEARRSIGSPPSGLGLLSVLRLNDKPLIVDDISLDDRSVGYPNHHPLMTSLVGVPIKSKGEIIGNLYLADKIPEYPKSFHGVDIFTMRDCNLLEMLATQAAIAIDNAQLYRKTQQLAVLQERERFGMDLHDGIIQSIYALGLMLEDSEHRIDAHPEEVKNVINVAISGMNEVIRDIRNYILDLRPQRFQGRDIWEGLTELTRDFRANTFMEVTLDKSGQTEVAISPQKTVEILHIVQEALSNVRKHARASFVEVGLIVEGDVLIITVEDNGVGINLDEAFNSSGSGLGNMNERASSIDGKLHVAPSELGGTCITLYVPN